jgi:hypothetical protein
LVFSFVLLPACFVSTALANEGDRLLNAAFNGNERRVQDLLIDGADVNYQNEDYGASALMAASQTGETEIVKILLFHDADVNLQSKEGSTALLAASYNRHDAVVKLLLAAGAEVNHQNPADETALSLAKEERAERIIQLLLAAGARDILKRCPNPNVQYKTWAVKEYWQWFVTGHVTERIQAGDTLCVKYSFQYEHGRENGAVLFALETVENRQEKEAGIQRGIQLVFEMNEVGFNALKDEDKIARFNKIFTSRYMPRLESVTGLKFDTPRQWFDWIKANKNRLALDGKYVVVR